MQGKGRFKIASQEINNATIYVYPPLTPSSKSMQIVTIPKPTVKIIATSHQYSVRILIPERHIEEQAYAGTGITTY